MRFVKIRWLVVAIGCIQVLTLHELFAGDKEEADIHSAQAIFGKSLLVDDVHAGPVDIHGYASQGFLYTGSGHNFPTNQAGSGDARMTDVAINGNYNVLPDLRLGMQVYAGQLGNRGEMVPEIDWAVIDYQPSSYFGIKAGRVKEPLGFYNEALDIDAARTFVFLPMGFYDPRFRTLLNSFDGGMLYGNIPVGKGGGWGNVDYGFWMGQKDLPTRSYAADRLNSGTAFTAQSIQENEQAGFSLVYNTPLKGLRMGSSYLYLDRFTDTGISKNTAQILQSGTPSTINSGIGALGGTPFSIEYDSLNFFTFSTEYTTGKWDFNGELMRFEGVARPTFRGASSESPLNQQSWYLSADYHVNRWLSLGTYFNQTVYDYHDQDGTKHAAASGLPKSAYFQNDLALASRFDISRNWIFKLEGHLMNGTSLEYNANGENPNHSSARDADWYLLAAKTTWSF